MPHGRDTETHVFFYEAEFYPLSNYSAFKLYWRGHEFQTLEHAYHWEKFSDDTHIQRLIERAPSAHQAQQIANEYRDERRPDWDDVKVNIMREMLLSKVGQHEYVRRKLLETGDRMLVEDSWRDDFWGWGPDQTGRNQMGRLWMEIRDVFRVVK